MSTAQVETDVETGCRSRRRRSFRPLTLPDSPDLVVKAHNEFIASPALQVVALPFWRRESRVAAPIASPEELMGLWADVRNRSVYYQAPLAPPTPGGFVPFGKTLHVVLSCPPAAPRGGLPPFILSGHCGYFDGKSYGVGDFRPAEFAFHFGKAIRDKPQTFTGHANYPALSYADMTNQPFSFSQYYPGPIDLVGMGVALYAEACDHSDDRVGSSLEVHPLYAKFAGMKVPTAVEMLAPILRHERPPQWWHRLITGQTRIFANEGGEVRSVRSDLVNKVKTVVFANGESISFFLLSLISVEPGMIVPSGGEIGRLLPEGMTSVTVQSLIDLIGVEGLHRAIEIAASEDDVFEGATVYRPAKHCPIESLERAEGPFERVILCEDDSPRVQVVWTVLAEEGEFPHPQARRSPLFFAEDGVVYSLGEDAVVSWA